MRNAVQTIDLNEFMRRNRGWLMAIGGVMLLTAGSMARRA